MAAPGGIGGGEAGPHQGGPCPTEPTAESELAHAATGEARAAVYLVDSAGGRLLAARLGATAGRRLAEWQSCWEAQEHGSFCALASVVAAAKLLAPDAGGYGGQGVASQAPSQRWLWDSVVAPRRLMTRGVSLADGARIVEAIGLSAEARCSPDESDIAHRLSLDIEDTTCCVLANYWRPSGGHWSPVAALSGGHLLVMDTNAARLPPHWVPLESFARMLCRHNAVTGKPRGYLVVRDGDGGPLAARTVGG